MMGLALNKEVAAGTQARGFLLVSLSWVRVWSALSNAQDSGLQTSGLGGHRDSPCGDADWKPSPWCPILHSHHTLRPQQAHLVVTGPLSPSELRPHEAPARSGGIGSLQTVPRQTDRAPFPGLTQADGATRPQLPDLGTCQRPSSPRPLGLECQGVQGSQTDVPGPMPLARPDPCLFSPTATFTPSPLFTWKHSRSPILLCAVQDIGTGQEPVSKVCSSCPFFWKPSWPAYWLPAYPKGALPWQVWGVRGSGGGGGAEGH